LIKRKEWLMITDILLKTDSGNIIAALVFGAIFYGILVYVSIRHLFKQFSEFKG
jgi:hypothetical protein